MVGEPLGVLADTIGMEGFDRFDDAGMKSSTAVLHQTPVSHIVCEGALERRGSRQNLEGWLRKKTAPAPPVTKPARPPRRPPPRRPAPPRPR
jgi:hypothetical protein